MSLYEFLLTQEPVDWDDLMKLIGMIWEDEPSTQWLHGMRLKNAANHYWTKREERPHYQEYRQKLWQGFLDVLFEKKQLQEFLRQ